MAITKRLLIRASADGGSDYSIIPVNSGKFVQVITKIGTFSFCVFIRNFDGCEQHKGNSLYNSEDGSYLNGEPVEGLNDNLKPQTNMPNLSLFIKYKPNAPIRGSELIFGNDCPTSVKNRIPTTLLSSGLKFFSWFINPTIKADLYSDFPYLYGLALNSFTKIGLADSMSALEMLALLNEDEELKSNDSQDLDIPLSSSQRQKFFCNVANCEKFTFEKDVSYYLVFDTNFIRIGDSKYHVAIPTFRDRTFDIDVSHYADKDLNNFNWTIKKGGSNEAEKEIAGVMVNFSLVDEES